MKFWTRNGKRRRGNRREALGSLKSRRPLFVETLESRWLLDAGGVGHDVDHDDSDDGKQQCTPTITTCAGGTVVLGSGNTLNDSATLADGKNPTGTVTFYLFAPGVTPNKTDSNNVYSDTVTVNGDGTYDTTSGDNPGGYLPTDTGTYQWLAVYSGDKQNQCTASNFCDEPERVVPSPVPPTITTVAGPTVVLGNDLSDSATLSGGANPSGTITFYLFAPGINPNGTHSNSVYSDTVAVNGDGTYTTSAGTAPGGYLSTAIGTYQWLAVYSGDANNQSASSNFGDEPQVAVSPPAISTFEGGTLHLGSGAKLYDSAQLQGGMNPTGSITFFLFAPGVTPNATDSNNIYTDTVKIDPANPYGLYDVTMGNNPGGHVPQQAGTYQWVALYSGDANNPPQASEFGDEPQKVVPPTPVTPSIVTNPGGSVVLGSGATLSDSATLSGGTNSTGTVTFYLFAPGIKPNGTDSNNVYSDTVTVNGNGTYGTSSNSAGYTPTAIGTYQWVAVYSGDTNNLSATSNFGDEAEVVASPPAISTFQGGTLQLGSGAKLYDSAQLQGGMNPTGSITFFLFAPGVTPNATDSNNIYTDTVNIDPANPYSLYDVTMGNNPGGYVPQQTGTYQWVALYNGDANNPPQASEFGDEPQKVVPAPVAPTITTNQNGTVTLGSGGTLGDSATLSGGTSPTGTVTFYLFAPGVTPNAADSNNVYTDTVAVNGDGTYSTSSNSVGYAPAAIGTYQWVAVYSGDANNLSATSVFGNEPEQVIQAGPAITTNPGGTVILNSGGTLSDSATLSGGTSPTGTVTFYLFAPSVTPNAADSNNVYTDTVAVNGDGTYSTSSNSVGYAPAAIGTYQWVAVYSGDANNLSATSVFGNEPEQVIQAGPAITTNPGGTVILNSGGTLSDSATLSGGTSPTGTVTFYLFAPSVTPNAADSNNVYTDTVAVNGDGTYSTSSNSAGYTPAAVGTYQWVAVYSGDANNSAATSAFGQEPETVTSPPPPPNTQVVVFKIADQQQIDAGDTAGFTIKIQNVGAATAQGVTLSDLLPGGVANDINWQIDTSDLGFGAGTEPADFIVTGAAGHQTLSLVPSISTLSPGTSLSVHLTGQTSLNDVDQNLPPCTTTLVNTATVNAANEPANDQNAQATATVTLHSADVDVSKTADQQQVIAGQVAGFTIQIFNQGCVTATGVTLNDQLPEGSANDVFWKIDPNQASPEYFQLTGQIGQQVLTLAPGVATLAPNALLSVHVIAQTTANDAGSLNNTVTVNASNEPNFEDNAQATADITLESSQQGNALNLYVQAAIQQVLGRPASALEVSTYTNALANGSLSRVAFAEALTHSTEYFDDVVQRAYAHFLGRAPDAAGLQFWQQALEQGLTDEELEAQFIGSPEYYQHSGGTDRSWVDHMYFDLLGRAPDANGEAFWVSALAAGVPRSSVALGFAGSAERETTNVQGDYQAYLGRLASGSEAAGWVQAFEHGMRNEDVLAGFVASDEYFRQHD